MSANFSQFKDILGDLWSKVRVKVNEISNDYVSKSKNNTIKGTNVFEDLRVVDNAISVINNLNATTKLANNSYYCGTPSLSVTANTYVSHILIAVSDEFAIGAEVPNIKLAVVNKSNNTIQSIIATNGSAIVRKNVYGKIRAEKVILFPIQQTFNEEVYFVTGFIGMMMGSRSENYWHSVYTNSAFNVGTVLSPQNNASGNVPQYALFGEVNLVDKANLKLNNTFSGANKFDGTTNFDGRMNITGVSTIKYYHRTEEILNDGDNKSKANGYIYFNRNTYVPKDSYVTTLDIKVADDVEVGTQIQNVCVWEVTRLNDFNSERITNTIIRDGIYTVREIEGYGKGIYLNLNKQYTADTYLMIGQRIRDGQLLIATDNEGDIRRTLSTFGISNTTNLSTQSQADNRKIIYKVNIEEVKGLQEDLLDLKDNTVKTSDVGNEGNKIPRLSNGKLLSSLLPETNITTDKENIFTNINTFTNHSPRVNKTFTMASFNTEEFEGRNFELFDSGSTVRHFCTYSKKFNNNTMVTHLILPIINGQVGDEITARYFIVGSNNTVSSSPTNFTNYRVEDIEMLGFKCIRIPVNQSFNGQVAFGFCVETRTINNRRIGMAFARNTRSSDSVWIGSPNAGTSMNNNSREYVFPYKIAHETTSELVTRFELEKVTQMYPRLIGEYRSLAYEAGNKLEEEGHIWLRANGQAISKTEYPALFEKMNTSKNDDLEEIILPRIDDRNGYCYICAK